MRRKLYLLTISSALVLAACSETGGTDLTTGTATMPTSGGTETTSAGGTEGTSGDTTATDEMAEFQAEIQELSDAISESEAADDLRTAWNTLSAELAAGIASIREDGAIAREEIESGLEEFEQRLDDLDVEEDVRTAWESLRTRVEDLMTTS